MHNDGTVSEIIDDKTTPSEAHRRPTAVGVDVNLLEKERKIASGAHNVTEPVRALTEEIIIRNEAAFWFLMIGGVLSYITFGALIFMLVSR